MSRAVVLHHPHRTATPITEWVAERWRRSGVDVDALAVGRRPEPDEVVEHLLLVTPVLGDERLPDASESGVRAWGAHARTHRVLLTGDFRTGQTASPVADEADRLLVQAGSVSCAAPLLVDTPVVLPRLWPVLERELARQEPRTTVVQLPPGPPHRACVEEPLRQIARLLPAPPLVRLDGEGRCVALALVDGRPYPRSTLAGLPPAHTAAVLALAAELPALQALGLPYAGLQALPGPLPAGLAGLDLRGNPLSSFACLREQTGLRALNLAACDLARVPPEVSGLSQLDTLVLAKNRLTDPLPRLQGLPGLRRLTLYRNQIALLGAELGRLSGLRLLNVGANPLPELPAEIGRLRGLEVLGLRLLPLAALPEPLVRLPALRQVDVSKTSLAPQAGLPGTVRLRDGMPRWAWDDGLEPGRAPTSAAAERPYAAVAAGTAAP